MFKVSSLIICSILFLFLINPVFADSGFVSFETDPGQDILAPGRQYIIKVIVRSNLIHTQEMGGYYNPYCNGCPIKIKLDNPQDTDSIIQSDTKTDESGGVTAKIISNILGKRSLYAEVVMQDGTTYTSTRYVLNYSEEVKMEVTSRQSLNLSTPDVKKGISFSEKRVSYSQSPSASASAKQKVQLPASSVPDSVLVPHIYSSKLSLGINELPLPY